MKRLLGDELKNYFKDPHGVPSWWNPEEGRYHFWHRQEFKILDAHLKRQGGLALDAACGQGRFARYYARNGYVVKAFDINHRMLLTAAQRAAAEGVRHRIDFIEGDVERAPWGAEQFDLVSCMHALDHMTDVEKAIRNLTAPLKKHGMLVVSFTPTACVYAWLRNLYTVLDRRRDGNVDVAQPFAFDHLTEVLARHQIAIRHVCGIGLTSSPQERIRFPVFVQRLFELMAKLDLAIQPYHRDTWLAQHCSVVMIIGERA